LWAGGEQRGILELEEEHSELESEVERLQKDLDALKNEHHKNMEEFNKQKRSAFALIHVRIVCDC